MKQSSSSGWPVRRHRRPLLKSSKSSHALTVHGCGPKETVLRKKLKESSVRCNDGLLEERLWKWLPEEILEIIFARLPFAAQSRLQCVCRRWKGMRTLSLAPCTIICKTADGDPRFYCDSEQRWFRLPSEKWSPECRTWELVDADAGLVCYRREKDGTFWFWVCNPLRPAFGRVFDRYGCGEPCRKVKLIVDRATEGFQVVTQWRYMTELYDSRTSRWEFCYMFPHLLTREYFLWHNVVYAYSPEKLERDQKRVIALNVKSHRWSLVSTTLPSEFIFPMNRFILSDNKQVMVVLFSYNNRPRSYFSVWKLIDDEDVPQRRTSFPEQVKWEKVRVGSERDVIDLTGHRLVVARYNADHVWFIFKDDKTKEDSSTAYI